MFANTMTCSVRRASSCGKTRHSTARAVVGLLFDHLTATPVTATAFQGADQRFQRHQALDREPMRHRPRPLVRPRFRHREPLLRVALHGEHALPRPALHQHHSNTPPGQRVERMRHGHPTQQIVGNLGVIPPSIGRGPAGRPRLHPGWRSRPGRGRTGSRPRPRRRRTSGAATRCRPRRSRTPACRLHERE